MYITAQSVILTKKCIQKQTDLDRCILAVLIGGSDLLNHILIKKQQVKDLAKTAWVVSDTFLENKRTSMIV